MKRIAVYFTILLLSATYTYCQAQEISLGFKSGISIPNLTASGSGQTVLSTGYSSGFGLDEALFAELKFTPLFSVQVMAEYSEQGGIKNGMQAFTTPASIRPLFPAGEAPQYLYGNFNNQSKLHYLMVPVLAKFTLNIKQTPLQFFVAAGPFVSILLSASQVTSGSSPISTDAAGQYVLPVGSTSFNNTQDIKSQLNTLNVGVEANLGFAYNFGNHQVFIEGVGNYGFLSIQKNAQDGKNYTGAGTALLGYCYHLNRNKPLYKHN